MARLKDSGSRREFAGGAVRDLQEGKGRCDLLPLDVCSRVVDNTALSSILKSIDSYLAAGSCDDLLNAVQIFMKHYNIGAADCLLDLAIHYEDGCVKYGERNWENGIPLHCYIDSGVRHLLKCFRGDVDEPHHRAFIWNMFGAVWTHENLPSFIDLKFPQKIVDTSDSNCAE